MPRLMAFPLAMVVVLIGLSGAAVLAAPPSNPPSDPYPFDNDPYPPTNAILYYVRNTGYLADNFVIDIGDTTVSVKLVPKNLEDFAVGYYTAFSPDMAITAWDPLWIAIEQRNLFWQHIWPRWFNDNQDGYVEGEQQDYWPGWRFYYEDREWDVSDKDIDDLWVDIGYMKVGSSVWIIVKASCNEALLLDPFEMTFEKQAGDDPVYFGYVVSEEASGGGISYGSFVLDQDPVTVHVFDSGDTRDFGIFYGTVPALPAVAVPIAALACGMVLRRKRRSGR